MNSYTGQTTLVTGANGFIAGRLVERLLLEEGARVRVLMRNWTNAAWIARLRPDFVEGDVSEPASLDTAIQGCDRVFHCASGGDTYDGYMRTNVQGTDNLISTCLKHQVQQIVYLSSITVHGSKLPARVDQHTPLQKTGRGYSDSKVAAEELIQKRVREEQAPVAVIRPTFVWGPRAGQFTAGPLASIKAGTLRLMDQGHHLCPAVYVDNLVDLILLAGLNPLAIGQIFLATDGQQYTWADFFNSYARIVDRPALQSLSSNSQLTRVSSRSVEKLGQILERFQGNPAPFWKKVTRRSARIVRTWLMNGGVPDPWYLNLYSSKSHVSIENARQLLSYHPRFTLEQGMAETERWVLDQLGVRLELTDAFGKPHRTPVFSRL
jgi:nucleoside-diphosphate-sugar epimerase